MSTRANLLHADYLTPPFLSSVRHRGRERKTASGAGSGVHHPVKAVVLGKEQGATGRSSLSLMSLLGLLRFC
jgi:hypothetical protein